MPHDPIWVASAVVMTIHTMQINEHGGRSGVRDLGLLESALAHPRHLHTYGKNADICALASAYAFSLSQNHPFIDGNKGIALVVMVLFLQLNGFALSVNMTDRYTTIMRLATREMDEEELADWLRENTVAIE